MKLFSLRRLGVVLVVMAAVLPLGGVSAGAAPHAAVRAAAPLLPNIKIDGAAGSSSDSAKVKTLAASLTELAAK